MTGDANLRTVVVALVLSSGCGSNEVERLPAPVPSPTSTSPTAVPSPSSPVPAQRNAPASVEFEDTDPTIGRIDGDVVISAPNSFGHKSTHYPLFWGDADQKPMGFVFAIPAAPSGGKTTYRLAASIPTGARYILVRALYEDGESAPKVGLIPDGVDRTVTLAADKYLVPSGKQTTVFDASNRKLFVARHRIPLVTSPDLPIAVFRCEVDGTSCFGFEPSAGTSVSSAEIGMAVDAAGKTLYVTSRSTDGQRPPVVFRCALDGTSCSPTVLPFVRLADAPQVAIDSPRGKVIFVAASGPLLVQRCGLDLTGCETIDIFGLAGQTPPSNGSGSRPRISVDETHGRVHIADSDGTFVCNATFTTCSLRKDVGSPLSLIHDPSTGNIALLKAGTLERCAGDLTSCNSVPLATQNLPSMAMDPLTHKLHVVVTDGEGTHIARCNHDAGPCEMRFVAKRKASTSETIFDPMTKRLLTLTQTTTGFVMNIAGPWPP